MFDIPDSLYHGKKFLVDHDSKYRDTMVSGLRAAVENASFDDKDAVNSSLLDSASKGIHNLILRGRLGNNIRLSHHLTVALQQGSQENFFRIQNMSNSDRVAIDASMNLVEIKQTLLSFVRVVEADYKQKLALLELVKHWLDNDEYVRPFQLGLNHMAGLRREGFKYYLDLARSREKLTQPPEASILLKDESGIKYSSVHELGIMLDKVISPSREHYSTRDGLDRDICQPLKT